MTSWTCKIQINSSKYVQNCPNLSAWSNFKSSPTSQPPWAWNQSSPKWCQPKPACTSRFRTLLSPKWHAILWRLSCKLMKYIGPYIQKVTQHTTYLRSLWEFRMCPGPCAPTSQGRRSTCHLICHVPADLDTELGRRVWPIQRRSANKGRCCPCNLKVEHRKDFHGFPWISMDLTLSWKGEKENLFAAKFHAWHMLHHSSAV